MKGGRTVWKQSGGRELWKWLLSCSNMHIHNSRLWCAWKTMETPKLMWGLLVLLLHSPLSCTKLWIFRWGPFRDSVGRPRSTPWEPLNRPDRKSFRRSPRTHGDSHELPQFQTYRWLVTHSGKIHHGSEEHTVIKGWWVTKERKNERKEEEKT